MKLLSVVEVVGNNILEIKYLDDSGVEKMILCADLSVKNDFDKICDMIRSNESVEVIVDGGVSKVGRVEVKKFSNKVFSLEKDKEKVEDFVED